MKKENVQILVNAASVFIATLTFLFGSGIILKSCSSSDEISTENNDSANIETSQNTETDDEENSKNDDIAGGNRENSNGPFFLTYEDAYSMNDYLYKDISRSELLTDNYGTTYYPNRVISVRDHAGFSNEAIIDFYIDYKYTILTGIIYIPELSKSASATPYVEIYGDDVLLYELPTIDSRSKPVDFEVDISNVEFLTIKIDGGWYQGDGSGRNPMCCVADLAVSK